MKRFEGLATCLGNLLSGITKCFFEAQTLGSSCGLECSISYITTTKVANPWLGFTEHEIITWLDLAIGRLLVNHAWQFSALSIEKSKTYQQFC